MSFGEIKNHDPALLSFWFIETFSEPEKDELSLLWSAERDVPKHKNDNDKVSFESKNKLRSTD